VGWLRKYQYNHLTEYHTATKNEEVYLIYWVFFVCLFLEDKFSLLPRLVSNYWAQVILLS
jgi:hypothetical protein